nr:sister-chromatid cohesion protein 3 [Tanacetum cinerariifolium]
MPSQMLHFLSKLPRAGFYDILKNLQDRTRNMNTDEDPSSWRPYLTFVDTLPEKSLKKDEREGTSANGPDEE